MIQKKRIECGRAMRILSLFGVLLIQSCMPTESTTRPDAMKPVSPAPIASQNMSFDKNRADYYLVSRPDGYQVIDRTGIRKTVTFKEPSILQFSNLRVNLPIQNIVRQLSMDSVNAIVELYIGFFNRLPDSEGLAYWMERYLEGVSIEKISDSFYQAAISPEFSSLTGYTSTLTNEEFIRRVYKNVLARDQVDREGLDYWTNALVKGAETRSTLMKTILASAHTFKGDKEFGWVADYLDNRIAVSRAFAIDEAITFLDSQESYRQSAKIAELITPTDARYASLIIGRLTGKEISPLTDCIFHDVLVGSNGSLSVYVEQVNAGTGLVSINGADSQRPSKAFTFDWGDGNITSGFFTQSHSYTDRTRNYLLTVTASYEDGKFNTVRSVIKFTDPKIQMKNVRTDLAVTIPVDAIKLTTRQPGYGVDNLLSFDESYFSSSQSRKNLEYILSQAATIEDQLLEGDYEKVNDGFNQFVLHAPNFLGAFSVWYSSPVALGMGNGYIASTIDYSSIFHEMGHNFTLNAPAAYRLGGKIDGNANAILSETLAQLFQHTTSYELVKNAETLGIPAETTFDICNSAQASLRFVRDTADSFVANQTPFASWNDVSTQADETFGTFMVLAHKFFIHTESNHNYKESLIRTMRILRKFNPDWQSSYAPYRNTQEASKFRSTLIIAAISYGVREDLRSEFAQLGFPIDDVLFQTLYANK